MPSSCLLHFSETKSNLPGQPAPPGHAWLVARSLPPASDDHQEAGIGLPWQGLPPVLPPAQWQDGVWILQWLPASVVPAVSLKGVMGCLNFSTRSVSQSVPHSSWLSSLCPKGTSPCSAGSTSGVMDNTAKMKPVLKQNSLPIKGENYGTSCCTVLTFKLAKVGWLV